MRFFSLFKPSSIKKGLRYLRLLGLRLLIHAVMEKLRGRSLFFYNEERIMQDSKKFAASKSSTIHEIKQIHPEEYKLSIIIPSDNLENITQCIENLTKNTTYPNYEIVIVTNSKIARQLEKFRIPNSEFRIPNSEFRIRPYDRPFNFSDKCNEGAKEATGNVLCFYNDDICPIDSDWIESMLQALTLPDVGAVTPLQMADDKLVLTAGNVLSTPGLQTFAFAGARYTPPRHLKSSQFMTRDVSVISGACFLIKKDVFNEVGMYNAENTPNSFSDTEISLKIREHGYRCVITPNTLVLHDNKNSWRKTEKPDKAFLYMMERFGKHFTQDAFFTDEMKTLYKIAPPSHIYKYYAPENILPRKSGGRDILFVSNDLHRTGAPTVLMDMASVAIENGDWPVVVSFVDGPLRQEYLDMGVIVIIDNSICDMTDAGAFAFDYVVRNFDLVVINTLACWRAVEVLSDSLPPVLWWIHESPYAINLFKDSLPDRLSKKTKAYAVSDYCAKALNQAGITYNLGRLTCGISDDSAKINRKNIERTMVFLVVGSIEHTKGQDVLVQAIELLDSETISKVQFILIGSQNDSKIMTICENAAATYDNFTLLESMPKEELRKWYEKADCLVIPSREDTLSMVGLEACMLSVPIISSDNVGLSGYMTQNESGLIFPSEDHKTLAKHITFAVGNREKMAELGKIARKEIYEKHFTMSHFKDNFVKATSSL